MKVLKFGGTSLGDAARMQNVAKIISRHDNVLVVLSAVSGTTNALVGIVKELKSGNTAVVTETVETLKTAYELYIAELLSHESAKADSLEFVQKQLDDILKYCEKDSPLLNETDILAKGEIISTQLFHLLLVEQRKSSHLLDSLEFLRLDQSGQPDENHLSAELCRQITANPENRIFIAQGFICLNSAGEISNLDRGGSDYSASLFGAAVECDGLISTACIIMTPDT